MNTIFCVWNNFIINNPYKIDNDIESLNIKINQFIIIFKSFKGNNLNPNDIANPCGLVARSFFNDIFTLHDDNE